MTSHTSESSQHPRAAELQVLYEKVLNSYEHRRSDLPDLVDEAVALATEVGANDIVALSLIRRIEHYIFSDDLNRSIKDIGTVGKLLEQNAFDESEALMIKIHWYNVQAHQAFHNGNLSNCRDLLLQAVNIGQLVDDNLLLSEMHVHLGVGYGIMGDMTNCLASWKKVMAIFPYNLLGDDHKGSTQQLAARRVYAQLYGCLGFASLQSGNYESAYSYFHNSLEVNSVDVYNNALCYTYLSEVLIQKNEITKALEAADHAVQLAEYNQAVHAALYAKAKAHFKLGDFIATIESCERALSVGVHSGLSSNFVLYSWLALSYAQFVASDSFARMRAQEYLSKAEAELPNAPDFIKSSNIEYLAEAKFLLGNITDAFETLRLALRGREEFYTMKFHNEIGSLRLQIEAEQEKYEKELEQMKRKQTEKELSTTTMSLAMQTELLGNFRNDLRHIVREIDEPIAALKKIKEKLKTLPCEQIDWVNFEKQFTDVHPEFRAKLIEQYPDLTKQEVKMCQLARLGLKNFEISRLLCISERSVETHRFNLRKKLGLKTEQKLSDFLAILK